MPNWHICLECIFFITGRFASVGAHGNCAGSEGGNVLLGKLHTASESDPFVHLSSAADETAVTLGNISGM